MLAKASSPLYCVVPGVVALWHLVKGRGSLLARRDWLDASVVITLVAAAVLNAAALAWYTKNMGFVIQHVSLASSGPAAELYGKADSFGNSLLFWLHLLVGVTAGAVILFMSVTGVILAFEPQITDWLERDRRIITPPPDARPLSAEAILAKAVRVVHERDGRLGAEVQRDDLELDRLDIEIDDAVRASLRDGRSLYTVDAELLAELAPDVIVTQDLCAVCAVSSGELASACPVGAEVISLDPQTFDDVAASIERLAG
jgi:hypothetical protein